MFDKPFAMANEFSLIKYENGNGFSSYWIKYKSSESFYQVSEGGTKIQFYDGEVFDLTFDQLVYDLSEV